MLVGTVCFLWTLIFSVLGIKQSFTSVVVEGVEFWLYAFCGVSFSYVGVLPCGKEIWGLYAERYRMNRSAGRIAACTVLKNVSFS